MSSRPYWFRSKGRACSPTTGPSRSFVVRLFPGQYCLTQMGKKMFQVRDYSVFSCAGTVSDHNIGGEGILDNMVVDAVPEATTVDQAATVDQATTVDQARNRKSRRIVMAPSSQAIREVGSSSRKQRRRAPKKGKLSSHTYELRADERVSSTNDTRRAELH